MNLFIAGTAKEGVDSSYLEDCDELLSMIASIPNIHLVFGGYRSGVMRLGYDNFKKNNKKIVAVSDEVFQSSLDEIEANKKIVTNNTIGRTNALYNNGDCLLFLPGGLGTYSELFSMIEENKNNSKPRPVILYNCNYFYTPIVQELYHLYEMGFVESTPSDYMMIESDKKKIYTYLKEREMK